jgi:hypothetical protein
MQQFLLKKEQWCRIGVVFTLVSCLGAAVFAKEAVTLPVARQTLQTPFLVAMADFPDFLAPAPTCKKEPQGEKGKEGGITPFIGTSQSLTLLPTPQRPAIAASDVPSLERPEVTAGVNVDLGKVKFNLGYTLPSEQVDEFIRPFGVDLESGSDGKCFSLGVKVPF